MCYPRLFNFVCQEISNCQKSFLCRIQLPWRTQLPFEWNFCCNVNLEGDQNIRGSKTPTTTELPVPRSTSTDMPKRNKYRTPSSSLSASASSSSSSPARSLDDDDVPMQAPAASSLDIVHDPHAVKLCASLPSLSEQLKKLARGRDETVSRFAEEKAGADIYEVSLDRVRGSLSVRCLHEIVEGLDAATMDTRQSLAHEIAQRKADIAGLEQEAATLTNEIRRSKGEGVDVLSKQLCNVNVMIGKHQDTVAELEARSEVQVKVKVKRVRTCVELLKTETSSEDQEVKMMVNHCPRWSGTIPQAIAGSWWRRCPQDVVIMQLSWQRGVLCRPVTLALKALQCHGFRIRCPVAFQ
eukprot:g74238.t1